MADTDALKKYLDAGMAFTHLTRARAEQVVKDLVAAGELQRSQAKGAIDELLERSRKNAETLSEQVRKEVDSQLASLGLARKADVERLEAELAKLKGGGKIGGGKSGDAKDDGGEPPSMPAPAKKTGKSSAPAMPARKTGKSSARAKPAKKDDGEDGGEAPIDSFTPVKKVGKSAPAPAPAKKATKVKATDGGDAAPVPHKSTPAKKTAKKQG